MNKKTYLLVILVIAIIIGGYLYFYNDKTANWSAYINNEFKYQLKFPETWNGSIPTEGRYPSYSYASFSFKGDHQPFALISVLHYTSNQWAAIPEAAKNRLLILYESDKEVLAGDGCVKSDGNDNGGGQFDQFQIDRCKEGPMIIETFKKIN